MTDVFQKLYDAAKAALNPRKLSEWVEAGGVAAAIEAGSGKIYTGVCVDSACTLGICAERNAVFHMLTEGESTIRRVVAVGRDGHVMPPCGACRELMTQLMPKDYRKLEILMDESTGRTLTLGDLTPEWWV